tara:strand:+ start:1355 stop:2647 length:1293 start_codon:yes stop_codon:yes gene_type:complete
MTSPKQIKCPECNAVLKIDDANYASIINQVRDQLFEDQLNKRIKSEVDSAVKINENQLKITHQKAIHLKDNKIKEYEEKQNSLKKDKEISLATQKLELKNHYQGIINNLDSEIKEYKATQSSFDKDKKIAISEEVQKFKEEKDKLLGERNTLKNLLDYERREHQEEIQRIKENKLRLSTKMVGESLEESCLIDYDRYIRRVLPSATFKKDNDISSGSKGDYIFEDFDHKGNKIISIMFEMKNEEEGSIKKQTNKEHFKKLDKDRRDKGCEYAVLISNLEPDDERYNSGFTTVYHEYPKMIVARPNCFVSVICTLRELGIELLCLKDLLEKEQSKSIDITNFRESLEALQLSSSKNLKFIFNNINSIVKQQDRIIAAAEESKEILLNALTKNSKNLDKKLQGISVEKLIKNNPTMTLMFENLQEEREIIKS